MKKKDDGSTDIVADFDTVKEANAALKSLIAAKTDEIGWDAKEYKADLGITTKPKPVAP
jgi:hypothetical protein